LVGLLEGPVNFANNYGTRLSGLLIPPVSGSYHFWMSSDDEGEFWLSTDDGPANLQLLCREPSWNGLRQFTTLERRDPAAPENRSSTLFPDGIPLVAGQRYYFEALCVEGGGADNLSVAWQVPGSAPPQDGDEPISGLHLAYQGDAVNATIQITQQPGNATAPFIVGGVPRLLISRNFSLNHGGFSVAQAGNPMGAWTYDGANGVWSADGSDNIPLSEKLLTSPKFTVTTPGGVRLSFQHRFNFEAPWWDGGQVRKSINGAPFAPVPAGAFTSNGYSGTIVGDGALLGQPAFGNTSPGYSNGEFITSVARLGVLTPGDTVSIQFQGMWDWNTLASSPNWAIKSFELTEGHPDRAEASFAVQARSSRSDSEPAPLSYAWQRDCGTGFIEIAGANESVYRFTPEPVDHGCRFRCVLLTPGASATSEVATLTLVLPAISITRDNAELILNWTGGVLQEAQAMTGPWTDAPQATSPLRRTTSSAPRFFRLRSP
jgi:hypothetical protein